jgi:hypothetical protein
VGTGLAGGHPGGRILESASRHGTKVAWHLERYDGCTAASTVADINYITDGDRRSDA